MVIGFLIVILLLAVCAFIAAIAAAKDEDSHGWVLLGWLIGAFTAVSCFCLFYQIFPHVCDVTQVVPLSALAPSPG